MKILIVISSFFFLSNVWAGPWNDFVAGNYERAKSYPTKKSAKSDIDKFKNIMKQIMSDRNSVAQRYDQALRDLKNAEQNVRRAVLGKSARAHKSSVHNLKEAKLSYVRIKDEKEKLQAKSLDNDALWIFARKAYDAFLEAEAKAKAAKSQ